MKDPQIISIAGENPDLFLMVWGGNVITDTDPGSQVAITDTPIDIQIDIYDVTGDAAIQIDNATLVYDTASKWWRIPLSSGTPGLGASLTDRHKYVARVSEESAASPSRDMREFALEEFAVDNGSFEETLMRLPYEVKSHPTLTDMHIIWYNVGQIGVLGQEQFMAPVYQDGSGTVPATDATRVTHRGAIVPYA